MRDSKILSGRTPVKVILVGVAFFLTISFFLTSYQKNRIPKNLTPLVSNTDNLDSQETVSAGLPVRLKIPSIDIDVALEYVGLTPAGAMAIPKSTDQVGWFELGERPGDTGSAVIAGHYGLKNGKASAFDNLHKLAKGDKVYIEDDKGVTVSFVVRESRNYDPAADATDVFSSDDEKSHLNLITCEGIWNKDLKSFSKRLVVFSDKE